MPKEQEEVEISNEVIAEIAEKVIKGINTDDIVAKAAAAALAKQEASVAEQITSGIEAAMKAYAAVTEKAMKKAVGANTSDHPRAEKSKEVNLLDSFKALLAGDNQTLKEINEYAIELRAKAGYNNATVLADGGYVVMLPEFEAEIEKLVPNYGVAFREATIVPVEAPEIWTNKRGSNVAMFEVGQEGGQKLGTKLTISQTRVTLREFAAIAIVTNRLSDDAAIDFWQELAAGFAEARALIVDQMVFTETSVATPGLLHLAGTIVEPVGAAITSVTWDDLLTIEGKLPSAVQGNLKYYMHRTVWHQLLQVKDSEGRYQLPPFAGFKTPWGREVVIVDVMPPITSFGDANEGYIICADLKRTKVYMKRGLELTVSADATVHDADGNAVNLFEKNMRALRAECRMIHLTKFPEAVGIIGTGTVS